MAECLALAGLEPMMGKACLLGIQLLRGKPRLADLGESEFGRGVLQL